MRHGAVCMAHECGAEKEVAGTVVGRHAAFAKLTEWRSRAVRRKL